jgi:hypothetical protein
MQALEGGMGGNIYKITTLAAILFHGIVWLEKERWNQAI